MKEYITGTVTMVNGDVTVTGSGTSFANNVSAGDWFRVDADGTGSSSVWYEVSSVTDATHLELTAVYAGTGASGRAYTISEEPNLPPVFHPLILYKTALDRCIDRDAKQTQVLAALVERSLGRAKQNDEGYNTDTHIPSIYQKGRR
jgi:hypothetical protein